MGESRGIAQRCNPLNIMFVGKVFQQVSSGNFRFSSLLSRYNLNQTMKCARLVKAEKRINRLWLNGFSRRIPAQWLGLTYAVACFEVIRRNELAKREMPLDVRVHKQKSETCFSLSQNCRKHTDQKHAHIRQPIRFGAVEAPHAASGVSACTS